jgi:hypothetical protein
MLNAYHINNPIITRIIISRTTGFATSACVSPPVVCLYPYSHSSSRLVIFLVFKVRYLYATPASPARIFPIYVVLSHGFGATSNSCVSTENSEMKVELTLLIAAMCKSRCGARAASHVHPRSVPAGAQTA